MPTKTNLSTIVAGCEVMEHIENHKGLIDEAHRVLKPNGTFVFTIPNIHNWYSKLYFLFKNQFPYFRYGAYYPLRHTRPLIMNLFKEHIEGKSIIELPKDERRDNRQMRQHNTAER